MFRAEVVWFRVQVLSFCAYVLRFDGCGLGCKVVDLGFRVEGLSG